MRVRLALNLKGGGARAKFTSSSGGAPFDLADTLSGDGLRTRPITDFWSHLKNSPSESICCPAHASDCIGVSSGVAIELTHGTVLFGDRPVPKGYKSTQSPAEGVILAHAHLYPLSPYI